MLVYNSNLSILGNVEIVWKWRQVLKRSLLIANSFCVYTILYRIRLNNQFPRTESQIFDSMQNKIPWIWFNFGRVIADRGKNCPGLWVLGQWVRGQGSNRSSLTHYFLAFWLPCSPIFAHVPPRSGWSGWRAKHLSALYA